MLGGGGRRVGFLMSLCFFFKLSSVSKWCLPGCGGGGADDERMSLAYLLAEKHRVWGGGGDELTLLMDACGIVLCVGVLVLVC
ncbi:hypothetical protein QBC39DRAFT_107009 [Podospora conica]|nr:hypothetical protein QBC39DRAFT_107009 [Schizothecium conicum]